MLRSGTSCSVHLAEPNLFLPGFDPSQDGYHEGQNGTAFLRGTLRLCANRKIKIKCIQLKLLGRTRLGWSQESAPDFHEECKLQTQVSTCFNAVNNREKNDYGFQCDYSLQSTQSLDTDFTSQTYNTALGELTDCTNTATRLRGPLSFAEVQRQGSDIDNTIAVDTRGQCYKIFHPGIYDYTFTFPVSHHQLETTRVPYGSVKWELRVNITRPGVFKINICGRKDVEIVRIPDPLSLDMMQPILLSREWEQRLHYDIVVGGKSFPIGGTIPILLTFGPLDKVEVHGFEILIAETVEYSSNNSKVHKRAPTRTVLLLNKTAEKAFFPLWAVSGFVTVRDGEFNPEPRQETCEMAAGQRSFDSSGCQKSPRAATEMRSSLFDTPNQDIPTFWGSTDIETSVQIPTCTAMSRKGELRLYPKCTWKNVAVKHYLK
ncbi:hypothetical protein ACLX1H_003101 [Fusarium chlamydosporum]